MGNRIMTAGNFGKAYYFDGIDDNVNCGNSMAKDQYAEGTVNDELKFKYDSTNYGVSQSFKVGGSAISLTAVELKLLKVGSPTSDGISVEIRENNSGVPGNLVTNGTSEEISIGQINTSNARSYLFKFVTKPSLSANTTYHIVFKERDGSGFNTTNYISLKGFSSSVYGDGVASYSNDIGNWTNTSKDLWFRTYTGNGSLNLTGTMTIEAVVCLYAHTAGSFCIMGKKDPDSAYSELGGGFKINMDAGGITFVFDRGDAEEGCAFDLQVPFLTWMHIGITYNEGVVKCYINGALIRTVNSSYQLMASSKELLIGTDGDGGGNRFSGVIDEVRISKVVRTFSPLGLNTPYSNDSDTVVLLHFEGNANDSSSNGNNGTVSGAILTDEYGLIAGINASTEATKIDAAQLEATTDAKKIATGNLKDGVLSADATGWAKMADGYVTHAKIEDKHFAYGQIYRNTSQGPIDNPNSWNQIVFTTSTILKNIIFQVGIDAGKIKVNYAGIYRIQYWISAIHPSNSGVIKARIVKNSADVNSGTEVEGSFSIFGYTGAGNYGFLTRDVIESLGQNEYIRLAVGGNYSNMYVNVPGESPSPANTVVAILTIEKIGEA
ncbi:MAG: LamG-like jellyroll fold domain-containing protein [Candidatus Firestonebacteria bacterium]